jgi:anaerobic ribonucleoside-triphosphate reductase/intein/homing endonuclease
MKTISVIKRDGTKEPLSREKIMKGIMKSASEVGGEDTELADKISAQIENTIVNKSDADGNITAEQIQNIVEKELIEGGYAKTAKQFILKSADRNRMREMNTSLMKEYEEITFASEEESEVKRENANIDSSTAMGTMLKYGSEGAKSFNLLYMMSQDIAEAHRRGDIHIHDLDFFSLTDTCVTSGTRLYIKHSNIEMSVSAENLFKMLGGTKEEQLIDTSNIELYIESRGKYVRVKNMVSHGSKDKTVLQIRADTSDTNSNKLYLVAPIEELVITSEHLVSTSEDYKIAEIKDVKASELKIGDNLIYDNRAVPIVQIKPIDYEGMVYDLETENHHFDANGFLVHNCDHIPIDRLFKGGFNTGHGYLREPGNIRTAANLAAIAVQSNQNDMHGGQSIPLLDYYLAPYVALSYVKNIADIASVKLDLTKEQYKELKNRLVYYRNNADRQLVMNDKCKKDITDLMYQFIEEYDLDYNENTVSNILDKAYNWTNDDTYQAMEAFIHNLNTLHSRSGGQVPFSSVNYGTDTSTEGRMLMHNLLDTTEAGLGNGETAIFPVQIFKLKDGVSHLKEDPNYDLYIKACRVSALRMYPNFLNLDAPYNAELYVPGNIETEMATMGCVEGSEYVEYMIDSTIYIESFKEAYDRIERTLKSKSKKHSYSERSEFIDTSEEDIRVKDTYSNTFVKVNKIIRNKDVNNWKKIRFTDGISSYCVLTATEDHPLPVEGKGRTFVKGLVPGDRIKLARNIEFDETDNILKSRYFRKDTWLLGLLFQSNIAKNGGITIDLNDFEYDLADRVLVSAANLGYRANTKQIKKKSGEYIKISLNAPDEAYDDLKGLFRSLEQRKKVLSSELLTCERDLRVRLLAGLLERGKTVRFNKLTGQNGILNGECYFRLESTSKEQIMSIMALIKSLGYKMNMYTEQKMTFTKYIVDFEISNEVVNHMHCLAKIDIIDKYSIKSFMEVSEVEVAEISDNLDKTEQECYSYDMETESDRLDISFIQSHNCRTRVGKNVHDPSKSVIPGRGNLSFTSINLPRLGIEAHGDINKFYESLDKMMDLVHRQLLERFEVQCKKHPRNYPFLMGQGNWVGSENLGPDDDIREVLSNGTFGVGFIGLAETLVALTGKHHGESEESQKLGLEIIGHMREMTDKWSEEEKMNYGVIATPAEGLSGRFIRLDKKKYGIIPGVTDRDYYTNSSHVPVYYPISATKKVDIEAPYHFLESGGHILYIEMDGDPTKNLKAFKKIVDYMHDKGAGYMAVNHPLDYDPVCKYSGIITDVCPRCGRREGEPMTMEMWNKIKGYANAGNANTLGYHGDTEEEKDRLVNPME